MIEGIYTLKSSKSQVKTSGKVQELYTKRALTYESLYVKRPGWGKELHTFFLVCYDE
jgi:hypothetical protein